MKNQRIKLDDLTKNWLIMSFAVSFMISIFAPLENYFANQTEFWFDLEQLLPGVLIVFILTGTVLFCISKIIQKSSYSIKIYSLILCLFCFFYVQGNYVPRNYGVLNGTEIEWNNYHAYALVSIILFIMSLVAWTILYKKLFNKIYLIGKWIYLGVFLIQIITLGTLYIQKVALPEKNNNGIVVTTEKMFDLSEKKNILVFVLDTFDSSDMMLLLNSEEGELYKEVFDNFTYYPDTLGGYPTTKGALPHILTGVRYENEEAYDEYVRKAYVNNNFYDILNAMDYSIGVYTSSLYVNPECDMYTNITEGEYVVSDYNSFYKNIYKLVAFNYMPHQLKKFFYVSSADFDDLKATTEQISFSSNVQSFYNILKSTGIELTEEKCFRFYHLDGTHAPYTFDKNLQSEEGKKYTVLDEAAGNFKVLEVLFNELKTKGIYDSSTIIIMADHGYNGLSQNPLFMIKNMDEHHEFQISDMEMSYDYLNDIFISLVNNSVISEEFIAKLNSERGLRKFYNYSWDNSWDREYLPTIAEYELIGTAENVESLILTGKTYSPGDKNYLYGLGTELSFKDDATANTYCLYGFSYKEGTHTWTNSTKAAMKFSIDGEYDTLCVYMEYGTFDGNQEVLMYANDNLVAHYIANGYEEKEILIPAEYIYDNELILRLEFPNASSPRDKGTSDDGRMLALSMQTISLSATEKKFIMPTFEDIYHYSLGEELSFTSQITTANKYCINGFSGNEPQFTWTNGNCAEMQFNIDEKYKDLLLNLEYIRIFGVSQHVIIYANNHEVANYVATGAEIKTIIIPEEYVEDGLLTLRFELPDADSPLNRGESTDSRLLALAMKSLTITSTEVEED